MMKCSSDSIRMFVGPRFINGMFGRSSAHINGGPVVAARTPAHRDLNGFVSTRGRRNRFSNSVDCSGGGGVFNSVLVGFLPVVFLVKL